MRKSVTLLLILAFLTASSIATPLPVKADPKTIVVPDDYPTIQAAVGNASAGDIVCVKKGTYYAPYNQVIVVEKSLSLIGEDPENTVIDGIDKGEYSMGHYVMTWNAITIYASNVTIRGFTIKNCNTTISIDEHSFATDIKIIGNNIVNNHIPITIWSGSDFLISGNNITDNDAGVGNWASNTVVSGNNITGLGVWGCQSVTIRENNINGYELYTGGLSLLDTDSVCVYENNITDNLEFGIRFERSCNNTEVYSNNILRNGLGINVQTHAIGVGNKIYYNNIIDNTQNARAQQNVTDTVAWDNGKVGNYWSDYQSKYPNATEVDDTGIGDTPYIIGENNRYRYPISESFSIAQPKILVLSPLNQVYNESSVSLVFTVNKPVYWTGYSIDGAETVTITGNTTLTGLSSGLHNVTVYAKDLGNVGTSETVIFTAEPFPTKLVAVASAASIAVIVVVLLVYFKKRKH